MDKNVDKNVEIRWNEGGKYGFKKACKNRQNIKIKVEKVKQKGRQKVGKSLKKVEHQCCQGRQQKTKKLTQSGPKGGHKAR